MKAPLIAICRSRKCKGRCAAPTRRSGDTEAQVAGTPASPRALEHEAFWTIGVIARMSAVSRNA